MLDKSTTIAIPRVMCDARQQSMQKAVLFRNVPGKIMPTTIQVGLDFRNHCKKRLSRKVLQIQNENWNEALDTP